LLLTICSSHPGLFQTAIFVEFKPINSIDKYELEWKEIEHPWTKPAGKTTLTVGNGESKVKGEASNLNPGMTYCIRAYCVDTKGAKGDAGPDMIIDTEQVGCTPKSEKSCCVVQ
jgi:hypothetical protein